MPMDELEEIEPPILEKQENLEESQESKGADENRAEKDSKLDAVIDVSGQKLDFFRLDSSDGRDVQQIYAYKNELSLIPRGVARFKNLRGLKFFANEVNVFSGQFGDLAGLECLQVKVPEVGFSGLELAKLSGLKELEISRVPVRPLALPLLSEIAGLKRLTRLSICHFSIRYLPPEIGCLKSLEHLNLSFNWLRNLPEEITLLSSLISLKVTNNKLIALPPGVSNLQRLENLDLSNNRLTSLEHLDLESMHNLRILNLQHNQVRCNRIPSWIYCSMEGNSVDLSYDESSEMDVYEDEGDSGTSVPSLIRPSGLIPNTQRLAIKRADGRKHWHNLRTKARQECLNHCRKWNVDAAAKRSLKKCMNCRVSVDGNNSSPKDPCVVEDVKLNDKDLLPEDEVGGNSQKSCTEDCIASKANIDGCSCSPIDSDAISRDIEADGPEVLDSCLSSQASENGSSRPYRCMKSSNGITDEELDNCSSSQASTYVKSKRHYERDLDYPRPTKSRRPTNDPNYLSWKYSEKSFCGLGDYLPDGFYDAGRDRPFVPLVGYEKSPHVNLREVIVLDRERDEELSAILFRAQALMHHFKQMNRSIDEDGDATVDTLQAASLLALFVSDHFGGSDKTNIIQKTRKAVSGVNCGKPFICTCSPGISYDSIRTSKKDVENMEVVFRDICETSLNYVKERFNSIVVPIGNLQFGICRHRALLMKYLCDRMEPQISCELVRGYLDFSPHAWNVVVVRRGESLVRMIVDACHPHDIRDEGDPEYFCRYIPLSRVNASFVVDANASPNDSFPSLSASDEIGKQSSTSLMRCNVGSHEAAVKVRKIVVSEATADQVRNFEFCCLGEVRMLSALKHSCIVEFYGHQISSKWSITGDGYTTTRTIQSAIMMEYIKGGSLKSYVDKLSSTGEKHVALGLAFSIARDVASALTELHSKNIIHRDIKSENILIDLEKKRDNGTAPIVKICDFDRAIPLHSYMHRCCIQHFGIPPPNVCVGTPRWMAPEVFRAMHEPKLYGLEVDIWSYGCVLLELLTLQVPYFDLPESEIHNFLQMGERPRLTEDLEALAETDHEPESESEKTLKFLVKLYYQCTRNNPEDRPTAEEIYNSLLSHGKSLKGSSSAEQQE